MRSLIVSCGLLLGLALSAGAGRERVSFDAGWKFHLGDIEVEVPEGTRAKDIVHVYKPEFDECDWRVLDLPHDWAIEQERKPEHSGYNGFFPGGIGWYRKDFLLPKEDAGKHIEIQFDGIYRDATVWINGYLLGTQYDGYTSFYHDISKMVVPGETNTVVVKVECTGHPISRWYSGSGIYRHVWLTKTSPLHIQNWGTSITTPEVSEKRALVSIQTEIENYGEATAFILETEILNPDGKQVALETSAVNAERMRPTSVEQHLPVFNPELWSLESPSIYRVVSRIKVNGKTADEYESTFGIRSIEFDADNGFFLNGKGVKMKGVCLHHEAGSLGAAVPAEVWERRLLKLKEIGCNAIRTAHNPMAPEFMDLCDELGFLVMDEFVDKWSYWGEFTNPMFRNEWQKNFRQTIRRDRNHPSVVIWSVGNENHPSGSAEQNQGLREYCSFVRSVDPTRPVVSGMERGLDKPADEKAADIIKSCSYMDLIALNYGEQWCRRIHECAPGKPYVSTESYRYFSSEEETRHALIERSPWMDVLENDSNMGLFLWAGINYLGEVGQGSWPRNGSTSGLLDISGMPKEEAYLYKAFWSDKPTVHISVYEKEIGDFSGMNNWRWPLLKGQWKAAPGTAVDLVTYSNCEAVELYLNGKLIGVKKRADQPNWIMNWADVNYEPGALKAVGKNGGKTVCEYELKTPGEPACLELKPVKRTVEPGVILQVEIFLRDENGTLLCDDHREVRFKAEGAAIIALENGDTMFDGDFRNRKSRPFFEGSVLVILKAGQGAVKLSAQAEGLAEQTLKFKALD